MPSGNVYSHSLSADGSRLIYCDRNVDESIGQARVDAPRGAFRNEPERISFGSVLTGALVAITNDGSQLAVATESPPQHVLVLDEGELRQLTEGLNRNRQPAWSPDEEWLIFQITERFPGSYFALIRADGSDPRPTGFPDFPAWFRRGPPTDREWPSRATPAPGSSIPGRTSRRPAPVGSTTDRTRWCSGPGTFRRTERSWPAS